MTERQGFSGLVAVVTGAGTGIGRELVVQLAGEGCSVAACDIHAADVEETVAAAQGSARDGALITAHECDVADEQQVLGLRDEVQRQHATASVNLVVNNAGVHSAGSFIDGDRAEWDRVFAVCWTGVYNCSRAFVPMLVASDRGWLVNTSSVNGFWASHTAYSAAKFAVKGFTEALIEDFRLHAPHVKVAVVMPGYVGTDILRNSRRILADADDMSATATKSFRDSAITSAAQASSTILDGLRRGEWRILVGDDARLIDSRVRADPVGAYGPNGISLAEVISAAQQGGRVDE